MSVVHQWPTGLLGDDTVQDATSGTSVAWLFSPFTLSSAASPFKDIGGLQTRRKSSVDKG